MNRRRPRILAPHPPPGHPAQGDHRPQSFEAPSAPLSTGAVPRHSRRGTGPIARYDALASLAVAATPSRPRHPDRRGRDRRPFHADLRCSHNATVRKDTVMRARLIQIILTAAVLSAYMADSAWALRR